MKNFMMKLYLPSEELLRELKPEYQALEAGKPEGDIDDMSED